MSGSGSNTNSEGDNMWDGITPPLEGTECLDIVSATMRRYYDLLPPELAGQARDSFNDAIAAIKHLPLVNPPRNAVVPERMSFAEALEQERAGKWNVELAAFERYIDDLQMQIVASEPDAIRTLNNLAETVHFLMQTLGPEQLPVLAHIFFSCLLAKDIQAYITVMKILIRDIEKVHSDATEH